MDWLPSGQFSTDIAKHLRMTDNEVLVALCDAALDPQKPGHDPARRILYRGHLQVLYQRHPEDVALNIEAGQAVFEAAKQQFGTDKVRHDSYKQKGSPPDLNFPVLLTRDENIVWSIARSETLKNLPFSAVDYVFIRREELDAAKSWLDANRTAIIQ